MAINKVGSKGIVDCSVAAADFAPGTITSVKLADDAVTNAKLSNSSLTASGTSIALGASGTLNNFFVDWQSKVTSDGSTVTTMVAGKGYFVDNSSAAGIVKLPTSASIGDTIAIKDYAGNFGTNSLAIQRNGHNIQGAANDGDIKTNRASVILVYVDSTKGWLYTDEHNVAELEKNVLVTATGGTVTESGDFKIHTFTGDGNFVVSAAGGPVAVVDYLVIAGGGGGGYAGPGGIYGGGGAGGYRESHSTPVSGSYTASPLATSTGIPVTAQTYPVTVGAGGTNSAPCGTGSKGSNSVFSTITSAGGGASLSSSSPNAPLRNGGSGGGGVTPGGGSAQPVASGNTPPVSPPQGNNGGPSGHPTPNHKFYAGAGGGGAGGAGGGLTTSSPCQTSAGVGGAGTTSEITGSPVVRASGGGGSGFPQFAKTSGVAGHIIVPSATPGGGGAGGVSNNASGGSGSVHGTAGTANTGGGGGGNAGPGGANGSGGKGIVIIRYKFQ